MLSQLISLIGCESFLCCYTLNYYQETLERKTCNSCLVAHVSGFLDFEL